MGSELQPCIYLLKNGTTVWIDITRFIDPDFVPEWDLELDDQFYQFTLQVNAPKDGALNTGNYINLELGDEIVITRTSQRTEVLGKILSGVICKRKIHLFDIGTSSTDTVANYELTVRQKNYSLDTLEIDLKETQKLSYILNLLFTNENTIGLGGYLSDGTLIDKYDLEPSLDIDIPPFNHKDDEVKNILNVLLQSIGYQSRIEYIIEPHTTNIINRIKTVKIFSGDGINNVSPDWINGINRETLKVGGCINPYYDVISNPTESRFLYCEKDISFEEDATQIKNHSKILAYVISNSGHLRRFEKIQTKDETKFDIDKVLDIVYVAREVVTKVITKTSTKVFTIETEAASCIQYDSDRLTNNALGTSLVAYITSGGNGYYRTFTISGTTITLTGGNLETPSTDGTIASLTIGDEFRLINGYDILLENLDTYPGDVNGYVKKHVKPTETCYFEFTSYDKPNENDNVVAYYYDVEDFVKDQRLLSSILKFGQYFEKIEINYATTEEEINSIITEKEKQSVPIKKFSCLSYRRNFLDIGSKLLFDLAPFLNSENLILTKSKGKFITSDSPYKDIAFFEQNLQFSSHVDRYPYLLAKIQLRNEIAEAKLQKKLTESFKLTINLHFDTGNHTFAPVGLNATNITESSFTANVSAVQDAKSYRIDISNDNFVTFIEENQICNTPPYNKISLNSSTEYKYRWRAIMSDNSLSDNSNVITVTTLAPLILYFCRNNGTKNELWKLENGSTSFVSERTGTLSFDRIKISGNGEYIISQGIGGSSHSAVYVINTDTWVENNIGYNMEFLCFSSDNTRWVGQSAPGTNWCYHSYLINDTNNTNEYELQAGHGPYLAYGIDIYGGTMIYMECAWGTTKIWKNSTLNASATSYTRSEDVNIYESPANAESINCRFNDNGTWIGFSEKVSGIYEIFIIKPDGTNKTQITSGSSYDRIFNCFNLENTEIYFHQSDGINSEIYTVNLNSTVITQITDEGVDCTYAAFWRA